MKQLLLGHRPIVVDVPSPGFGRGQVLVEVAFSFISSGTEVAGVKAAAGGLLAKVKEHPQRVAQVLEMVRVDGIRKALARVRSRLETHGPLGYSCSGRVIACGADVTDLASGDWVACAGSGYASHAEVIAVPRNLVAKLPPGCDVRQASGTTVASIALQGVRRADLRLGETAVVLGLGLLGQISLQLLAASGVRVVGLDANPRRVEEGRQLGFDECFALVGEQAVNEVLTRTGQMGADAILVTAATTTPGICQKAIEMTRRKGRVVLVGAVPIEFEREPFYRKEIDFLISCSYGPGRYDSAYEEGGHDYPYAYVRWTENRNMQTVLQMIASGQLRLDRLISAEYGIADAEQAFASLASEDAARPLGLVLKYDLAEDRQPAKLARQVASPNPSPSGGRIGLGLIGLGGFFTSMHLPNIAALADRFQVVATCDRNSVRAQDVARQLKAEQACSDAAVLLANPRVQLVFIATQHDTHAPLSIAALRAGKHVFVEKPVAMNADQLEEVASAVTSSGRTYMVGYNRRFSPHVVRLRELVASRVGPLVVVYRVIADPAPPESWIYSSAGGGRVIGEGCHMLDTINYLVGDERAPVEVSVVAPPVGVGGPPGDNLVATIRYEDGSLGTLIYSVLGRKGKENGKERVEALWDGKGFVVDDYVRSFGTGCSPGATANRKSKGHYEELVALASHLSGQGPCPLSWEAIWRATDLSFRIDAACRAGGSP